MMTRQSAPKFAVVGHPISHSLSPKIHLQFATSLMETIDYTAIDVAPDNFQARIFELRDLGFHGLNVTVPFKTDAFALADEKTPEAEAAGAVNTLAFREGKILGHNSDGIGLCQALSYLAFPVRSQNLLILGAGGAVRGVLSPLLAHAPDHIIIANRSIEHAEALRDQFSAMANMVGCTLEVCTYASLASRTINELPDDLGIIQGTSLGLQGKSPELSVATMTKANWAYDMQYATETTPFLRQLSEHSTAALADGWSMLVAQAAESYRFWRGRSPRIEELIHHRLS